MWIVGSETTVNRNRNKLDLPHENVSWSGSLFPSSEQTYWPTQKKCTGSEANRSREPASCNYWPVVPTSRDHVMASRQTAQINDCGIEVRVGNTERFCDDYRIWEHACSGKMSLVTKNDGCSERNTHICFVSIILLPCNNSGCCVFNSIFCTTWKYERKRNPGHFPPKCILQT